eukprot:12400376-Karenia_brevis.AAC.1
MQRVHTWQRWRKGNAWNNIQCGHMFRYSNQSAVAGSPPAVQDKATGRLWQAAPALVRLGPK